MPEFSQGLFDAICERIAEGESLTTICKDSDFPSKVSFYKWLDKSEDLVNQYTRAKDAQADSIFEDCLDIADSAKADEIQQAKLQIDTRKWMAGKLRPKKYGDKLDLLSSDGSMTPKPSVIELVAVQSENSDEPASEDS